DRLRWGLSGYHRWVFTQAHNEVRVGRGGWNRGCEVLGGAEVRIGQPRHAGDRSVRQSVAAAQGEMFLAQESGRPGEPEPRLDVFIISWREIAGISAASAKRERRHQRGFEHLAIRER